MSVKFLGFLVSPEGMWKDPEYVQVIKNLAPPSSLKSLQITLGLLNWCAKFIPQCVHRAQPLYELLRQAKKRRWGEEHSKCLEILKEEMVRNIMLVYPDLSKD